MRGKMKDFRIIAALSIFLAGALAQSAEPEYKPVKVPMWPGLRQLVKRGEEKVMQPYLKTAGGDILLTSDLLSEVTRGGTNAAASLGNGRLSVEISPWAQLTVVRWPSPLYGQQLRYYTLPGTASRPVRMDKDAPSADWRRYGHPVEPCESLGSRGGLLLDSGKTVWLGDPSWTSSRGYHTQNSMNLFTRLTRPDSSVQVTDFVDPDHDVLVRQFDITGPVKKFFYHATFAPVIANPAEGNGYTSKNAGFATVYLASDQVVVAFKPKTKEGQEPKKLAAAPDSFSALDAAYPEGGTFVAWGFMEPASGFQVGASRCQTEVPADAPQGGFDNASTGKLSGNALFIGPGDAALSRDLSGTDNEVTVIMAFADSAQKAVALVNQARAEGFKSMTSRSLVNWESMAKGIHVPAKVDPVSQRVMERSVLNVLAAQDTESGAIVASISAQPPYHYDYPRDSSFFDLMLDLAGFPEQVSRHHLFLARTQYTKKTGFSPVWMVNFRSPFFDPSGNWPQKMSTDGSSPTSFLMEPCEIDETALTIWNFWRHEKVIPEAEKPKYREEIKTAFMRSADNLLKWIDLKKGWTKPAIEDDSFPPDATLHGASSALTAMAAACDAGPRWGFPQEKTSKYCAAAKSLRAGIRGRTVYPEVIKQAGFRGRAWTLWPAPAFDDYNEPGAIALKKELAESIRKKASKEAPGFAYLGEEVMALALADTKGEYRDLLVNALNLLTHDVAFPGTDCYGEITLWGDYAGPGTRVAQQRTAIPHLWNGTTVYLAALAVYEPEVFKKMTPPAPK
jgi:hypothetical protein